ncbi:receptor-type tyrosine-protein phosphatase C isoform X2 [Xiphias gladius]|uniref:receptor-type tyrosine-protein phosphatase C isoform X2 n=1 Tax=Xiphias gladius TaxID=8245 RepID=UPI001A993010|nr:receptor-type tyrosine-protein phosphatase C isoform X2 [Xiphias gladius]
MAGLCGVKILLLWAGILALGKCQTSQDPQTQTSPAVTQLTTLMTTSTQDSLSTLQCSYTVDPIKFGFQFNIKSSTIGDYNITITGGQQETVNHSSQNSSHEIKQLKPCTEYEHSVKFLGTGEEKHCNRIANKTITTEMSKDDIEKLLEKYSVCFRSSWNISSIQSTHNEIKVEQIKNKTICFKPGYNDICSDFTATVTPENCKNSSFSFTQNISLGFLSSSDINQTAPTKLPANIETKLPPNCKNLSTDYTCWESGGVNVSKKLSELEPFTKYSCTGQIKHNNVFKFYTTAVHFVIDCDLKLNFKQNRTTNTSIEFSWTTTSRNCESFLNETSKISYSCSCNQTSTKNRINNTKQVGSVKPENQRPGGKCYITGLQPYTNYTCAVQPTYNKGKVAQNTTLTLQTKTGVPVSINSPTVKVTDHNVITVECNHSGVFNGPTKKYIARLSYGGNIVQKTHGNKCKFQFKDLSYLTIYTVQVTACNGQNESEPWKSTVRTSYNDKAVIGFLIFLIILTSVALLVVIYKIYILKRKKSHDLSENMMLISTANDEENLLPVEPIAAEVLLEAYKRKLADEGRLFLAEFQSIPRIFSRHTVKDAKKPCNVPKNRYVDILPYDYNRVQLTTGNGEAGCDYINASFIDGYKEAKKYIAAQGPKDETVSDFWRMVWEQQSSIIVMVTRCEEGNRVKCAQYWPSPERETEIFEEFIVKLNSEDCCPDYTIRHLSLTNKREKNSEREVTHIQFMSWPDHGVPGEPHLLLKLRRRVNAFKNFFSGPIVVHCSAGVGRTGTYIGIDAMMEGLEAEGRVDIYGYIVRLRRQRCLMVQVEAQYILIHQALLEHNQFGETEITLSELHSTLSTLKQQNSATEPTLMEDEFARLPTYKNWRAFNTGLKEENEMKNRSPSIIPYDYNRVLLKLDEGRSHDSYPDEDDEEESSDEEDEESTKYINASYISGYWSPRAFIAAQTPLPDTMADFWLMVYQKKASAIVMLSDCSEEDKECDSVYWDKDIKTFGDFEVEVTSTNTTPAFITRNVLIHHVKRKESRSVKQYQFLKWLNRELPENPQDLTDLIKEIKNSSVSSKSHITVVHCNDGSSRTGIFCALCNLLDSAKTEKLLDVFQVVKTLRKDRQEMLSSVEQYQFLYDALEGVFPVQNGELKAVQAPAAESVQIVNETKQAEQPASTTRNDQQGVAESTPLVADGRKEDKKQEPGKDSSTPTETSPLEDTSNGRTVTAEI